MHITQFDTCNQNQPELLFTYIGGTQESVQSLPPGPTQLLGVAISLFNMFSKYMDYIVCTALVASIETTYGHRFTYFILAVFKCL